MRIRNSITFCLLLQTLLLLVTNSESLSITNSLKSEGSLSSPSSCTSSDKQHTTSNNNDNNDDEDNTGNFCSNNNNIMMTSVNTAQKNLRSIRRILPQQPKHWVGDGFNVYPVFANMAFTNELSPFLMFDYASPKQFQPTTTSSSNSSKRRGVGKHPHRGFETVTIAFQGEVEHHDSAGNGGVIGPNDIQWMTAGRGIIHEEYHSTNFSKNGGIFEMCQLWINLPKKYKMTKPNYQPILNADVPVVTLYGSTSMDSSNNKNKNDGSNDNDDNKVNKEAVATARIIAGELNGTKGPAKAFSPVELWDINIPKSKTIIDIPFTNGHNCIVFVRRGEIDVITTPSSSTKSAPATKKTPVEPQGVALMETNGDFVRIQTKEKNTSILIMGGEPLNEPIAARGPFVMTTWEEIQQANRDYMSGKF